MSCRGGQPPSPGWGIGEQPTHTLGTAAGSPGGHSQPTPLAAQGAGSRRDSSAAVRVKAEGGEEASLLTPVLVAEDVTLSGRIVAAQRWVQGQQHVWVLQGPTPLEPSSPAHPQPSTYLRLAPQVQLFKLCEGQIRELVEAH